ncbi:transmembrane protein 177-like [Varroa destructor]|uniref:Transmembrane protein 177 n=1 Tax=Varroa destructor TaxID=109461 RepID=A0A7M7J0P2_VARDE|nr:transmembrane protein 177-like [Varroa destructor]XP_022645191.1 transmembrane protein 177-like [Varroa destructor]XP_022645192.1 transmembrane protein 177-like [Varroa destructor]XP_022645194.1 transmembrane protein 177-like [Varroa destructor]XP_022645195.1 transmembrane protein 177-like [Varroa destructor]
MPFFMTTTGRKVAAALAGIGGLTTFVASWLPQTIYLDKLKNIVQCYEHGLPLRLNEELTARTQSVLKDFTSLSEAKKASIRFFLVNRIEPFYAGTPESGYGAIIGLPFNFRYKSVHDIKEADVRLPGEQSIDWTTGAARLFKEHLILSDEAQRFAIAQQIYLANTSHVTVNSIAATGATVNVYVLSKILNSRIERKVPFSARCVVYGLVCCFCFMGYLAITDMARYKHEWDSLAYVMKLGPMYRQGAVDYFERALVCNKALRILGGKTTQKMFTVKGNLNTWIRTPHVPMTVCMERVKRIKKEMEGTCEVCEEISGAKVAKADPVADTGKV